MAGTYKLIHKVGLIILGILLIVFFELSLYFTGRIFLYSRNIDLPSHNKKFDKLICCIGDSHTFGAGALSDYSYPKQLEALLNFNNPQERFKVVNLGIPGNSTKSQVERLEIFLDKNKTDIVILLTGRNNYYEVREWESKTFLTRIAITIKKMRSYRIMQYTLDRFFGIKTMEEINAQMEMAKYEDYIQYQLDRAKSLCKKYGSRLLLISYYNSYDEYIERFAKQSGMLYFNLCRDFFEKLPKEDMGRFISRDGSHMNYYGYKIFSELLYKHMFLHGADLNIKLKPLLKVIDEDSFCENPASYYLRYFQGKSVFYEN